jgi:hypothetical protein
MYVNLSLSMCRLFVYRTNQLTQSRLTGIDELKALANNNSSGSSSSSSGEVEFLELSQSLPPRVEGNAVSHT